jgi:threonine synthase
MRYISTRSRAPELDFDDVLLTGLARDGGLYLPAEWPQFGADDIAGLSGLPYAEAATRIMAPFADTIETPELAAIAADAYARFDHAAVAPLRQLDNNVWLLELFHGPTLAFKDMAMQILGRLFDHVLTRKGRHVTIVGATSGDTGSAAIEACRNRRGIDIFILHPEGRVSEVQRRQMTTVDAPNVHNIAIRGTFDDCQALVKAMFNDLEFRDRRDLSAVNSINWARVAAQIVYYFTAAVALGAPGRRVSFSVPTGNFGCVFAGYAARQMGLPIERLMVATNRNDILHRFFQGGEYRLEEVVATQSPSMDIQVASNFERLLFDLVGRDGGAVEALLAGLNQSGAFSVGDKELDRARRDFASCRVDEATTTATIARVFESTGGLIDPHTAVAVHAAQELPGQTPVVVLGTAHPAKFPEAVDKATGRQPALPARLADLYERPEHFTVLDNDLAVVQDLIDRTLG